MISPVPNIGIIVSQLGQLVPIEIIYKAEIINVRPKYSR